MCPRTTPCNGLWITGIIILFVFGSNWVILALQRNDIWWTPATMKLSLEESSDRVLIFVQNEDMRNLVADGKLLIRNDGEDVVLKPEDVGLRLNNWDHVRASQVWQFAMNASMTTLGIVLLILGLAPMIGSRKKEEPEEMKPLN
jgi:hypothetical protein